MPEIEAYMQVRVRKRGQEADRTTGNLCWAEFVHLTSRPVNGVPCPQLHAHVFAMNATFDFAEGQWKAGQFGRIKGDAYYWQAVQQVRFANKLQEIGYTIRKTKDAFEIDGVPETALKKFSLRTGVIDAAAERLGITSAKSKAKLGMTTREAKSNAIPYRGLLDLWESRLTKHEAGALGVVAQEMEPRTPVFKNAAHTQFAVEHLFERASVVDEKRLLTTALRNGIGEVTPEGVRAEVHRHGLLKREENGKVWVTTPKVLAEESQMISFAVYGKGACKPLRAAGEVRAKDARLNDSQLRAVEHVLTSPDRVTILRGAAGTGKTTLAKEAVSQIVECGKHVVMLAPTTPAVRVLKQDGFDAQTLAMFLVNDKVKADAQDGVIWLDESGLVGSKSMAALFDAADKLNARVVLSGDKRQLASVERGAALRVLEDIAGLPVAEVTEIVRQKPSDYRQAVKLLSEGRTLEGYEKLDAMGCVKTLPVWDSYEPVAREYADRLAQADEKDRQTAAIIVCPTHAEGEKINLAVRKELRERGMLAADEREVAQLVPLQWTEAERGDAGHYTGDEVLQFHHNTGPFKAGQRVKASEALPKLAEAQPKYFSIFAPDSIAVSAGEMIRITGNGKTVDGRKLSNGALYQVTGFSPKGDLMLGNGWVLGKDFGQIAHAYVNTAFAAQGRSVDHALLVQSAMSSPAGSRESFYVASSRGRKSISIFTDDKRELKDAIQRSRPRLSATELVAWPKPRLWRRMRRMVARAQEAAMLAARNSVGHVRDVMQRRDYGYER